MPASRKHFYRILSILSALLLASSAILYSGAAAPAETAGGSADSIPVSVTYQSVDTNALRSWTFTYSDAFFSGPASEYSHDRARISLGLAISAFRNRWLPLGEHQTEGVRFLEALGFQDIRPEGYDTEPTADSISTILGRKEIGGVTLIALGICGSGYTNEWMSNLLVGNEQRHTGFDRSAAIVEQRIRDYLADTEISGPVRLWLSGFSRAAAVSNITAADMTDSGLFEEVYNISFATPRTTRDSGDHPNIFNIIGKNDPVPMIPLADWGYVRYGTDLYTPSQEADSRYAVAAGIASEQAELINGKPFRNNPDMNDQLRTVLDFLLAVMPESADYERDLQQGVIDAWANKADGGFMDGILDALEHLLNEAPEDRAAQLEEMISYLDDIASDYLSGSNGQIEAGSWDPTVSLADNIMHEHNPEVYLEWMFSFDDPEDLFTENTAYLRFTVSGDVVVAVCGENGLVGTNLTKPEDLPAALKSALMEIPADPGKEFHEIRQGTQTTVILPRDEIYLITVYSNKFQEISYGGAAFDPAVSVKGALGPIHTLQAEKGSISYLLINDSTLDDALNLDEDANETLTTWDSAFPYSPGILVRLEKSNYFHLTLVDLFSLVFLFVLCLGALLTISVILASIRLIRRRSRAERATVAFHSVTALLLFLLEETVYWSVPGYPVIKGILKGLISLTILILALKGIRRGGVPESSMIVLSLLIRIPADILMSANLLWGILCHTAAVLVLCACLVRKKQPALKQILIWLILWAIVAVGIWFFRDSGNDLFVPAVFCGGASLALLVLAFPEQGGIRRGSIVFFTSMLMLMCHHVFPAVTGLRFLGLAVYYIGEIIFAVTVWGGKRSDKTRPEKPLLTGE
ncbi:MAG: hypothetical protein Q4G19_06750 [Clostridia bacterium]|nr:hypothetical protein [Clostridia bacterium]